MFEADVIIIKVKEKGVYPTLIFLLFPSSSRVLFKLESEINIKKRIKYLNQVLQGLMSMGI